MSDYFTLILPRSVYVTAVGMWHCVWTVASMSGYLSVISLTPVFVIMRQYMMFVATCQCLYPVTSLTLLWHQCMFNRQYMVLSSGQHVAVRLPPTSVWSQWHICMFQQAAHGAMFGPACRCQVTSHLCVTLSMATCCWTVATSTTCLVSGALCPARWLSDQDWGGRGWQTGCGPCFILSGGCLFKISSKISFDYSCLCIIYKKNLLCTAIQCLFCFFHPSGETFCSPRVFCFT